MPKHLGPARIRATSFAAALILASALLAQGGHGQGGGFGGSHASGSIGHVQLSASGNAFGSLGGAVVPPIASTGRSYGSTGGLYHYGNKQLNQGFGYRRYPPGYIPYFAAAYPSFYLDGTPPQSTGEAYGAPQYGAQQDQSSDLMMELDGIHQELAQLQQRQAQPPYGLPQAEAGQVMEQGPSKPTDPPLVLVFRDGTRTEVRDFAVMGEMFWDLSVHPTRKFPISQLNVDASIKANEARGVEFPAVPTAK
jgi:hypothetical protein